MLRCCVGRPSYAGGARSKMGLQAWRPGRNLPGMSGKSYSGVSREFWARVLVALYRKMGTVMIPDLAALMGTTDEASIQRLYRWKKKQIVPPVPTCKAIAFAVGVPLEELLAPVEPEGLASDLITERYQHGNCA